jgi:Asp-tRNA(Asn)/Glu-tRNA(Gln) amidotransferase A subunit family amidase
MDKPPRIGIVRDFFFSNSVPEVQKHTEEVVQLLAKAGAQIEEVSLPTSFDTALDAHATVVNVECAAVHEEMFRTRADDFGSGLRETIQVGLLIPASYYVQAQRLRLTYRREMDALAQQWDVLLTPTTHMAAPGDLSTTGNPWFQSPWTTCGLPTITIPSGLSPSMGLPLGIQLAASSFAEGRLLAVARWCEQILDVHLAPPEAQQ